MDKATASIHRSSRYEHRIEFLLANFISFFKESQTFSFNWQCKPTRGNVKDPPSYLKPQCKSDYAGRCTIICLNKLHKCLTALSNVR